MASRVSPRSAVNPDYLGKTPSLKRSDGWVGDHEWRTRKTTWADLKRFARWKSNLGLPSDEYNGLDIDTEDREMAESLEALAKRHLGDGPVRERQGSAKRLIP
jgi:hypothetical protein